MHRPSFTRCTSRIHFVIFLLLCTYGGYPLCGNEPGNYYKSAGMQPDSYEGGRQMCVLVCNHKLILQNCQYILLIQQILASGNKFTREAVMLFSINVQYIPYKNVLQDLA